MKNFFRWLGIIALVATIGFGFTACDDGSTGGGGGGGGDVNGTWSSSDGDRVVINSDTFALTDNYGDEYARGTYSRSGNSISFTITSYSGKFLIDNELDMGISANQWYSKSQLRTALISYFVSLGISQAEATALYDEDVAEAINEMYFSFNGTFNSNDPSIKIYDATFYKGITPTFPTLRAPTGGKAVGISSSVIEVSWSAVPGAKSYKVYNSTSSSGAFGWLITETTTSITNFSLPADTTIYYKVSSVDANGREGPQSAVFNGKTLAETSVTLSLDGYWKSGSGGIVNISGSTGYFITFGTMNARWQDAVNKGLVKLGQEVYTSITPTSNNTWSVQSRTVRYNDSAPNVATGVGWSGTTITMAADGKSFTIDNSTYTRTTAPAPNYSLDGNWDTGDGGFIVSINGANGFITQINRDAIGPQWGNAYDKGFIKVGDQMFWDLKSAGNRTYTGTVLAYCYYPSSPNKITRMTTGPITVTISEDGQSFEYQYNSGARGSGTFFRQ